MRPWLLLLSIVLIISSIQAQAKKKKEEKSSFQKVLQTIFMPRPQATPKPHRIVRIVHPAKPRSKSSREKMFVVTPEWMANYWALEEAWDYDIPEDEEIEYDNGHYRVPFLVFKHYQDMVNTPQRAYAR